MEFRTLGSSDLKLPLVGLGCNNFGGRIDLEQTRKVVDAAIGFGITHFDTADIYGGNGKSEDFIGQVLGAKREKIVLATKFGKLADAVAGVRGTRAYILKAADASLKRLRTDWIDLLLHARARSQTPVEETLQALEELRRPARSAMPPPPFHRRPTDRGYRRGQEARRRRLRRHAGRNTASSSAPSRRRCCPRLPRPASA